MPGFRLPHPVVLLLACVLLAAALTHILPAGEYERRDDPATGRRVVVAGTYHAVDLAPVGVFAAFVAVPRVAYVIGVMRFGWGFNELSAAFLIAGCAIGVVAGLGATGTVEAYLDGVRSVAGAALLVGVARSISLVLEDGHVIDTILQALVTPLSAAPRSLAAVLMAPLQSFIHLAVPSVSGQAVLTMPVMVPMSDLLAISRQSTGLAYQTGAGLAELWIPTNGALMAILLVAGAPFGRWIRFVLPIMLVLFAIGLAGVMLALG